MSVGTQPSISSGRLNPVTAFARYDDLRVIGRRLDDQDALTLTAVMRDEMYFLPAFLAHYRALGVERFVIVDDSSTDGSREFLCDQEDCMVLESERGFNQEVQMGPFGNQADGTTRMRNVWANLLLMKYAPQRWSVHVDADEFLRLPEDVSIRQFVEGVGPDEGGLVWSVMIDLYPARVEDLLVQADEDHLDPDGEWYFDARKHARLRENGRLKFVYIGSRARLMDRYGVRRLGFTKRLHSLIKTVSYNFLQKPALFRLPIGGFLHNTHRPAFAGVPGLILPLEHFKFSGQLFARTEAAIQRNSHYNNSAEYHDMDRLLAKMVDCRGTFLAPCSSSDRSFANYRRVGIASGFDL